MYFYLKFSCYTIARCTCSCPCMYTVKRLTATVHVVIAQCMYMYIIISFPSHQVSVFTLATTGCWKSTLITLSLLIYLTRITGRYTWLRLVLYTHVLGCVMSCTTCYRHSMFFSLKTYIKLHIKSYMYSHVHIHVHVLCSPKFSSIKTIIIFVWPLHVTK